MNIRSKKGKNFKDVIAEEKNKGRYFKLVMKKVTRLNPSVLYGGTFLFFFIVLDVVLYALIAPSVIVWAGVLVVAAVVSSIFASKVTNLFKKQQWKYAS